MKSFLNQYGCAFKLTCVYNSVLCLCIVVLLPLFVLGAKFVLFFLTFSNPGMKPILTPDMVLVLYGIVLLILSRIIAAIDIAFFTKIYNTTLSKHTQTSTLLNTNKMKTSLKLTWIVFFENLSLYLLYICFSDLYYRSIPKGVIFLLAVCLSLIFPIWKMIYLSAMPYFFISLKQAISQLLANARVVFYSFLAVVIRLIMLIILSCILVEPPLFIMFCGYIILLILFPLLYSLLVKVQKLLK